MEIAPTPMNPTDATLWDIERDPSLRTTIVAVLRLDRTIDRNRLANDLEAASRSIPRMRQRVVEQPGGIGTPHWELARDFDVRDHLRFVDEPGGVTDAQIGRVASALAGSEFDRGRPLWECVYLGGTSGPAALLLKVHHSLTDGVGGVELLDALLDTDAAAPARDLDAVPEPIAASRHRPDPTADAVHTALRAVRVPIDLSIAAAATALHPIRTASGALRGLQSSARILGPSAKPMSPLMIDRSTDRHASMAELDLERLHAAAAAHGCTINHAFIAGVIGGVSAHHRAAGRPVERLRMLMPVSIRRSDDPAAGNQWAPVRFSVPADLEDPLERMLLISELVRASRREPALGFSQSLAAVVQMLPSALSSAVAGGMMHGVDIALTDVPGLTEPRYVGGAAVERLYAFAPTGGAALNVALVSHLHTACVGVLSDTAAVDDPDDLRDRIASGLDEVITAAEKTDTRPRSSEDRAADSSPRPAAERLTALDTGFLRMESRNTPMHLGGVAIAEGGPLRNSAGRIRLRDAQRHVEARLRHLQRFRRRLAEVPFGIGRPLWVDDPDFDITRHVQLAAVPSPGTRQDLLDLAAELHEMPLDRRHPLWELWIIDGLADGSVGIVEKVHHALVDGLGGVELIAAIFDLEPDERPEIPLRHSVIRGPGPLRRTTDAIADQLADPARLAAQAFASFRSSPARLLERVETTLVAAREFGSPSSFTRSAPFNRRIGRGRVLRAAPLDLDRVDAVREPLGATINDVVLACVAGGLRRWLIDEGKSLFDVHVFVPVSTRHGGMIEEPGNRVGGMLVSLPVAEADPERRLRIVMSRMGRVKRAHEADGSELIIDALDHVPPITFGAIARLLPLHRFANVVVTNVPGPADPLYLLGARIHEMVPIVPLVHGMGLGIAVLSYERALTIGFFADPRACRDIEVLEAAVRDELDALTDGSNEVEPTAGW